MTVCVSVCWSRSWALQKWVKRWSCTLERWLGWAKGTMYQMVVKVPIKKGALLGVVWSTGVVFNFCINNSMSTTITIILVLITFFVLFVYILVKLCVCQCPIKSYLFTYLLKSILKHRILHVWVKGWTMQKQWSDRDAICGTESRGSKELCIRWRSTSNE